MMITMKRYFVIAPNGQKCSVIEAGSGNWQTWSGKRKQWESFPKRMCILLGNCNEKLS